MKTINEISQLAEYYESNCINNLVKYARIRKLPSGKFRVLSQKGKNLGTSDTKTQAVKRLKQVEFFKHRDKMKSDDNQDVIDLMDADEFAYSAIMRKMRQKASKEQVMLFLKFFKDAFDSAVKKKLQKPEKVALQNSLIKFNKVHPIKLKKKLVKNAAVSELGDPALVGKYLSDIVKFTINKLSPDKRMSAIENLKHKFYADEVANKNIPASSSIGQSISFVKQILFGHSPQYIRVVLNNLVRNLSQ
jgi:hypothetical protein